MQELPVSFILTLGTVIYLLQKILLIFFTNFIFFTNKYNQ